MRRKLCGSFGNITMCNAALTTVNEGNRLLYPLMVSPNMTDGCVPCVSGWEGVKTQRIDFKCMNIMFQTVPEYTI